MFATAWLGFHKFSRGPSLMTFFTGSPDSGWTRNFRLDYIELPWVSLNITAGWVSWPRVMLASFMTACYVDEFYDRVLCWRVLWPRAMLSNFMTACYDVLWCRVLWPRDMLLSFMIACCDVEFYYHELWCRVSWPRAKMSSELAACQKWWVSWSRAKMSRQFKWLQP